MKRKLLLIPFLLGAVFNSTAQKKLTNQEIINSWCSSKEKRNTEKDSIHISFIQEVNKKVIELIDSLGRGNVDSILIYSKSYPGSYILNKPCFTTPYPEYIYVIWPVNGELNFKTIAGNCESGVGQLRSSEIFSYLAANKEDIINACIMPVILGAQRSTNKSIKYSMSMIDHEPNYSLVFKSGKIYRQLNFAESFLQNKKSLFWKYNLNLKAIYLWNLLEAEIGKSDKF